MLKEFEHKRDLIWFEGPLLSLFEWQGRNYLVYWLDVNEKCHVWCIIEVSDENLAKYLAGEVHIRYLQENAPTLSVLSGTFEDGEVKATTYDTMEEDWKAPVTSYFDDTLTYEAQYPNNK